MKCHFVQLVVGHEIGLLIVWRVFNTTILPYILTSSDGSNWLLLPIVGIIHVRRMAASRLGMGEE